MARVTNFCSRLIINTRVVPRLKPPTHIDQELSLYSNRVCKFSIKRMKYLFAFVLASALCLIQCAPVSTQQDTSSVELTASGSKLFFPQPDPEPEPVADPLQELLDELFQITDPDPAPPADPLQELIDALLPIFNPAAAPQAPADPLQDLIDALTPDAAPAAPLGLDALLDLFGEPEPVADPDPAVDLLDLIGALLGR